MVVVPVVATIAHGFAPRPVAQTDYGNEVITVYAVNPSA